MGARVPRFEGFVEGPDTLAGARPVLESGNARVGGEASSKRRDLSRVHMVRRPVFDLVSEILPRSRCLSNDLWMPASYPSAAFRFRIGGYSDDERRSFGGKPRHHLRRFARKHLLALLCETQAHLRPPSPATRYRPGFVGDLVSRCGVVVAAR